MFSLRLVIFKILIKKSVTSKTKQKKYPNVHKVLGPTDGQTTRLLRLLRAANILHHPPPTMGHILA